MTTAKANARVSLRDVQDADLPILFDHQLDEEAVQMAAFPSRGRDAFMRHWAQILSDGSLIAKSVLVDGRVAGNIVSFERGGVREIGYWIGREYWGQGVATQALSQLVAMVETRPLYAHVAQGNVASRRVLEKCGFEVVDRRTDAADGVVELTMKLAVS